MSYLALPASFDYLRYGSTAITNILLFQCGDRLQASESDVCRRQILTPEVDPRAERLTECENFLHVFPLPSWCIIFRPRDVPSTPRRPSTTESTSGALPTWRWCGDLRRTGNSLRTVAIKWRWWMRVLSRAPATLVKDDPISGLTITQYGLFDKWNTGVSSSAPLTKSRGEVLGGRWINVVGVGLTSTRQFANNLLFPEMIVSETGFIKWNIIIRSAVLSKFYAINANEVTLKSGYLYSPDELVWASYPITKFFLSPSKQYKPRSHNNNNGYS